MVQIIIKIFSVHQLFLKGFGDRNNIVTEMPEKQTEQNVMVVNQKEMNEQDENVDENDEEAEQRPIIALHLMPNVAYSSFLFFYRTS